jgi:5-hydroxyisourate hydrolase-like protein (transthyretin family)
LIGGALIGSGFRTTKACDALLPTKLRNFFMIKQRKVKNNPEKKKKPMNAFFVYRKALRDRIVHKYNTTKSNEISKIAGECWALEPISIKNMFRQISIKLHENARDESLGKPVQKVEIPIYSKEPESMRIVTKSEYTSENESDTSTIQQNSPTEVNHCKYHFNPYDEQQRINANDSSFDELKHVKFQPSPVNELNHNLQNWHFDMSPVRTQSTYGDFGYPPPMEYNYSFVPSEFSHPARPSSSLGFATQMASPGIRKRLSDPTLSQTNSIFKPQMTVLPPESEPDFFLEKLTSEILESTSISPLTSTVPSMDYSHAKVSDDILAIQVPTLRTWKSDSTLYETNLRDWVKSEYV